MQFPFIIKTPEEQYDLLVKKGLEIDVGKEEILHFLQHHSYFQLMLYFKRYWKYENNDHRFLPGVSRSLVHDTYLFDQELRLLFFYYISEIENSFKNNVCQFTCQKYGNIWWTDQKYFNDKRIYTDLINPILVAIDSGNNKYEVLSHYLKKYTNPKYPPFWNMLEVFTFGQVSLTYKSLYGPDKKYIAQSVYDLDNSIVENRMQCIVAIRNICGHHNKLYDGIGFFPIKIPKKYKGYDIFEGHEKNIFGIAAIVYYCLRILKLDNQFIHEMKTIFAKYHTVPQFIRPDWEEKLYLLS